MTEIAPNLSDAARERLRREMEGAYADAAAPPWLRELLDELNPRPGDENTKGETDDAS